MADSFALRVDGQAEIERALATVIGRVSDMAPLMDIIGVYLEDDARDNFEGEHSPAGVPWKPSQRALATGGKTLQDSRILFQSITHKAGPRSVEVGTNIVYARRHNQGWNGTEQVRAHVRVMRSVFGVPLPEPIRANVKAHSRKANTPKREFLGISPGAQQDILGEVADYLGAGL